MTRVLCTVCGGKGTINDPKAGGMMSCCGPNGETCPQIQCPNCLGGGFVGEPDVKEVPNVDEDNNR